MALSLAALPFVRPLADGAPGRVERTIDVALDRSSARAAAVWLLRRYGTPSSAALAIVVGGELQAIELDASGAPGARELGARIDAALATAQRVERAPFALVDGDAVLEHLSSADAVLGIASDGSRSRISLAFGPSIEADAPPRMLDHLERLMRRAAADRAGSLDAIEILDDDERAWLIERWNATAAPFRDEPVITRFFETAARFPDAEALVVDDRRYTYRELAARASRLARWLRQRGYGPGSLIGLCYRRDVDLVACVLAVLAAGAAYVPLDPKNPAARQALILDDAGVGAVLTETAFTDLFRGRPEPIVVTAELDLAAYDDTPLATTATPADLAYVIFTSGSTGRPKGVMIDHHALAAFVDWVDRGFSDDEMSGVLCASSIAFDVSVFELFGPLCRGGRTILVENILALPAAPARDEVRTISAVASGLAELVRVGPLPSGVRTVLQAGERLHAALAATLLEHPGIRLLNLCGGTEDTVYSVWHHVTSAATNPPIGRAFVNHTTYIVDEQLRPVPIGVPGEICYGGEGVAAGYRNRPDLSAKRFVPNPFGHSARMYRSGDLCRWNERGEIEFITRLDQQVKVRGHRVETAEIEQILLEHPAIAEALVVPRERDGDVTLAAYVVKRAGVAATNAALRSHVGERLPAYMIPSSFTTLAQLPHNASGKIDRDALPEPVPDRDEDAYVAPRDAAERRVAALWSEILGVERIGVHDDFFALGGHSLHAARIVGRLRERADGLTLATFFAAPTVAAVASRLHNVREDEMVAAPASASYGIVDAPVTAAQEMMWFLDRALDEPAAYNVSVAWRLGGELDLPALRSALDALVARHDQLRTIFPEDGGRPIARTLPAAPFPFAESAVVTPEERDAALLRVARTTFNLERGPLVTAELVALGTEQTLAIAAHHIVCDGWALDVLYRDLLELYAATHEGRSPQLAPIAVTYADYARGETAAEHAELYESDLAWWAEKLRDLPRTDLIGDRIPPALRTNRGGRVTRRIGGDAYEALRTFARDRRLTTFSALLAAYAAFVARHTGERDIMLGSPVANRRYAELEPLVGNFIQMLPLRLDVPGERTFDDLAAHARETLLEAMAHDAPPFRLVVDRVAPVRAQTQNPLFSVALVGQQPLPEREAGGTHFRRVPLGNETAKFDLLLDFTDHGDGVEVIFEYARDRFDEATMESLVDTYVHLVAAAIRAPQTPVARIPLVPAGGVALVAPRPQRDPERELDEAPLVHERLREHARTAPRRTALRYGGQSRSYGDLVALADAIRARLLDAGVRPGDRVGLCAQRSDDLVAAIVAVLDAGAAYVPLDPQYPAARVRYIAGDAALRVILTDRSSVALLTGIDARFVLIDGITAGEPVAPPPAPVARDAAAYVIYTSGSTGNPKGVVVEHRHVARLITAAERRFAIDANDVWTLFHSYAFDFSVWEIWGALAVGGTLVVVPPEIARSARNFRSLVASEGVTVLSQTPSAFYEFVGEDAVATEPAPLRLRLVIFGGEALDVRRLEPWYARHAPTAPQLVNGYGITETTVFTTFVPVWPSDASAALSRIGTPWDDSSVVVVDTAGNLVPPGFPGEIVVQGAGVARGYLDRPDLDAARYVDDPAGLGRGRSYRSGDIARLRVDGSLEYLGRSDHQVKIRGFRVELGEIESALVRLPEIASAVVLAEGSGASARLIAYVILAPGATLPDARTALAASLPLYMIPSAFVPVAAFPVNENGKLDRRALRAIEPPAAAPGVITAAGSVLERRLAQIVAELLDREDVGIDESFFALGGHSLLAARLAVQVETEFPAAVARLRRADGRGGVLGVFYREPTVRALAAVLEGTRRVENQQLVLMREGDPARTPVFWFHGMFNGDGLYAWEVMSQIDADVPFYVLHPHGYDNKPFAADIGQLGQEHLALIRSVRAHGPYIIGGFCNGALIAYDVATKLASEGEQVEELVLVTMPPLQAYGETLRVFSERIGDALRLRETTRDRLFMYLRSYVHRMQRFAVASNRERSEIAARAFEKARAKVRRARRSGETAPVRPVDPFADDGFKTDYYLRAIARYAPPSYDGRAHIIYGDEVSRTLVDPAGGWQQRIADVEVSEVRGGHFCVVDHAAAVGRIVGTIAERVDRVATAAHA